MQLHISHSQQQCGEDIDFVNAAWARQYSTQRTRHVDVDFFQPQADVWYTVWMHLQLNTAGAPLQCHCFG